MFIQEAENLYRLWVPFENIATSVFLLLTPEGPVLYDCATTAEDVERVILPALERMHIAPAQLRALVISHAHGDHNGGMAMLLQHAPQLKVIARKQTENGFVPKDGETLFGCVQAMYLPGHTADCLGVYDLRTNTLLTADALQLQGIGLYDCAVLLPDEYVQTIGKIRRLAPRRILTSHIYVPYGEKAENAAEIARYLDGCIDTLREIERFVETRQGLDAQTITEEFRMQHPLWPKLPRSTVRSLLEK